VRMGRKTDFIKIISKNLFETSRKCTKISDKVVLYRDSNTSLPEGESALYLLKCNHFFVLDGQCPITSTFLRY